MTAKLSKNEKVFTVSRPRITEKASFLAEQGIYVFDVPVSATKPEIKRAIRERYKVTPTKIRVINLKAKRVFVRGKAGAKAGGRKAYVHLKKGDKIEIS